MGRQLTRGGVRLVVGIGGAALIAAACWLLPRPLTSVEVLTLSISALAVALPPMVAVGLAAWALLLAMRLVRGRVARGRRTVAVLGAVSCACFAMVVWMLPDVATLAIGIAFAAALLTLGVAALLAALRGPGALGTRESGRQRHRSKRWLRIVGASVVCVLALTSGAGTVALHADRPVVDSFYGWDGVIPGQPGQVLRAEPYEGEIPAGAEALRVLYSTSRDDGRIALASAVIAFPEQADDAQPGERDRPVLAWQHGTTGVARQCAPSVESIALTEYAIPGISRAIERGWVVVATDYPGQGTDGPYPYLIGGGEGRSTLDAVRAAGQISGTHASTNTWLWGHSQGGHATLWAAQLADEYAPELDV